MTSASPPSIDELLAHRDWLSELARGLVRDPHLADDLTQDTWVAALHAPPPARTSIRGWLATVLRRRLADRRRAEARRSAREADVAVPEAQGAAPGDLVARMQQSERLLRAVLALPEPDRLVVLARWFEGLEPAEIGVRLGVPASTVRSRLARALERLRRELDARHGGRQAWTAALVVLVPDVRAPAPVSTALASGALAMAVKSKILVVSGLVVLAAAGGWVAGRGADAADANSADPGRADAWPDAAQAAVRERDARIASLERDLATRRRAETVPGDSTGAEPAAAAVPVEPAKDERTTSAPGLSAPIELDEHPGLLDGIDWATFARHSIDLLRTLANVADSLRKDGTVPTGAEEDVRRNDEPIAAVLRPVAERLPGLGPKSAANHPAFLGNALAAILEHAGMPLTADQRDALERLMRGYEARDHNRRQGYDDGTPVLRKVLDESALRQEFAEAAFRLLSEEQLLRVRPPAVRGRVRLDMLATGLFWADHVKPVRLGDAQPLEDAVVARVVALLQAPSEQYDAIAACVRTWLGDHSAAAVLTETDHLDRLALFRIERVELLARAQLDLWERLERDVELPQGARAQLRSAAHVLVPVLATR